MLTYMCTFSTANHFYKYVMNMRFNLCLKMIGQVEFLFDVNKNWPICKKVNIYMSPKLHCFF